MIKLIDNMLSHLFPDRSLYTISPFNVDELRDCIILKIIKEAYLKASPRKSLRAHRKSDADDLRMMDSRWMHYAQHYRDIQNQHIQDLTGEGIPELLPNDVKTMSGKLEGYKISYMQYFEIQMMKLPIIRDIISKRICDVKKISNKRFIYEMQEYDKELGKLKKMLESNDDEEVIFAGIALFTFEWKFNIELFYNCSLAAEIYKMDTIPGQRLSMLWADHVVPFLPDFNSTLYTESRFVLHRLKLVKSVYAASDQTWEEIYYKLIEYLVADYKIKCGSVDSVPMVDVFIRYFPRSEWANFFRNNYTISQIYKKKEWNRGRIHYFRKIIDTMIVDTPVPKL